ncbi:acyltransferase 3 [Beutenbergia cavernae DSM 12333]|uniref:Acyltransferase 3 n=1 Tax=Beutenbergia cavernae (strain ATCC BAA-8 / DSM 12333 / CCUG 43141 / JCM 11478 / NBRC 16432 / NCIMB 13614 / HKI 0122) TaxID=471853 RepID=C5C4V5_BEUC1|nr:acyltransferase [Beutenbergia cavernae]ACQ80083.1 acyltransferase 3 [Beutenbergia cavernae DSM 12333]
MSRDRYVDLLRAGAILVVVLGHWIVSAVTTADGRLAGVSLLSVSAWTHPLTWAFQVMPVFFLVGGFANAASWTSYGRRHPGGAAAWTRSRVLRLLRPTAVFLGTLLVAYAVATAVRADPVLVRATIQTAALSLWFLVIYVAVVALAPLLHAWHRRWGAGDLLVLILVVAGGDVARVMTGSPEAAVVNYLAAWIAIHQLGIAWHAGELTRSRRPATLLAAGGAAALLALTTWGPYAVTMVGAAEPPELGNAAPPTLALVALAVMQTGVVLLLRPLVDPWLTRPRVWTGVVAVNGIALTLYLWHMVPVVVAGLGLVGTGLFPVAAVGSGPWFALRVPWLAVLAVILAVLVAVNARWERLATPAPVAPPAASAVGVGVVACVLALAGVGLGGPGGSVGAVAGLPVVEALAFVAGLWLVRRGAWRAEPGSAGRTGADAGSGERSGA